MNELLKRCHKAHIKVLEDFKRVCEKHNLKYYAFCGTLLGAVRHKGFIPWDDDIDICMMRSDYNLFLYYAKQEMPGYYIETYDSYTPEESRHYDFVGITRINNTYVANFNEDFMERFCGFPYSAGIDLYPLDYVPSDDVYEMAQSIYRFLLNVAFKYKETHWESYTPPVIPNIELNKAYDEIYKALGSKINTKKDVLKQLNDLAVKVSSFTKRTNRVACMFHTAYGHKLIFPKSAFKGCEEVEFEDTTICIPADADTILKINYGPDYMIPDKRIPHDFPYYKMQERWVANFIIHNPEVIEHIPKMFIEDVYDEGKEALDKIYGGKADEIKTEV